ncbi:MAG: response regulator [Chloroflexi bacterium]|nr:response regulator [Chloroflexota bacterium]
MKKKILWIDDDYYSISGLFRPLEKAEYKIVPAISALDGFREAQKWQEYELIVVDLIIPMSQQQEPIPEIVKGWEDEKINKHVGIGIVKWLLEILNVTCPVVILSVVSDPIKEFKLDGLGISGYIRKSGLLPTALKDELIQILEKREEDKS